MAPPRPNRGPVLASATTPPDTALPPFPTPGPAAPPAPPGPRLAIGNRTIPIVLPNRHDPRLKLSAIIVTLQVLGQTVLDFKVSIAQILITIATCALVDMAVTLKRQGILAWPASALLTGNSIAFILRTNGTDHGDWWSLNGIEWFIGAALVSLLVKYLVRPGGRHRFNPSNVGIVWALLIIGPVHVFPQYLWWGPLDAPVLAALLVIVVGAVWILRAVRMLGMALAFLVPFCVLIALFALGGKSFVAIWSETPISGFDYWVKICTSPELFVFVFFMMSDPATAAKTPRGRIIYGVLTALVAAALVFVQPTEYGIKVAILASLTLVCAVVPLIEAAVRRSGARGAPLADLSLPAPQPRSRGLALRAVRPATLAVAIIAVTAAVGTAALADNQDLIYIERGLTGPRNAQ
ncbi:MAG: RnfABCDGE type electron transport complex subunit D [Actinobacteria bacterium]|nr:RnfABCDGE type electron transport complex subunit D [Actinomycetota bacterium]